MYSVVHVQCKSMLCFFSSLYFSVFPFCSSKSLASMRFFVSIDKNSVHGSDSIQSALREINFFFAETEIIG